MPKTNTHKRLAKPKATLQPDRSLLGEPDFLQQLGKTIADAVKPKPAPRPKTKAPKKKAARSTEAKQQPSGQIIRAGGPRYTNIQPSVVPTGFHKELVMKLNNTSTTGNFTVITTLMLNPANAVLFPNLFQQAALFEQFRFKHLKFEYVPIVNLTTASGLLAMYVDYDPDSPAVTNIGGLGSNETSTLGGTYDAQELVFNSSDQTWKYCTPGNVDTTDALARLNYPGDFRVCVDGITTAQTMGYLWIEYDVEFKHRKPAASVAVAQKTPTATYVMPTAGVTSIMPMINTNTDYINYGFATRPSVGGISGADNTQLDVSPTNTAIYHVFVRIDMTSNAAATISLVLTEPGVAEIAYWDLVFGAPGSLIHVAHAQLTLTGGKWLGFRIRTNVAPTTATVNSVTWTITPAVNLAYGAHYDLLKTARLIEPPLRTSDTAYGFTLPGDLEAATALLGNLTGPVTIVTGAAVSSNPVDDDEKVPDNHTHFDATTILLQLVSEGKLNPGDFRAIRMGTPFGLNLLRKLRNKFDLDERLPTLLTALYDNSPSEANLSWHECESPRHVPTSQK